MQGTDWHHRENKPGKKYFSKPPNTNHSTGHLGFVFLALTLFFSLSLSHKALSDDLNGFVQVDSYELVASERLGRKDYLLTYSFSVTNVSDSYTLNVTGTPEFRAFFGTNPWFSFLFPRITSYVDDSIDIGNLAPGESGSDTIQFHFTAPDLLFFQSFSSNFDGVIDVDSDGDGIPDTLDDDRDGDGVDNDNDAFPDDPTESQDSDSDGIGENADICPLDATNQCTPVNGTKNILLIVADDLGVDNVSGYGEQPNFSAQTPTLDDLAQNGVLFRNAWANPQCSPTRASILTGRHAFRHGVTHPALTTVTLDSDEETFAELLSDAGYQTALFGKWHLGEDPSAYPTEQGFDYYSGSLEEAVSDYFSWEKTTIISQGGVATTTTETTYATQYQAEEAIEWINNRTGPWLAEVSFNAPHTPFHVPPAGRYSSVTLSGAEGDRCNPNPATDDREDCYRAMVETMDSYIADMLAQIDPAILDDTLIIFMGDNGTPTTVVIEEAGLPFLSDHAKGTVYEGGINVPLIISGGANLGIDPGEELNLVQIQDVFSTILELANVPEPAGVDIDGQSLIGYVDMQSPLPDQRNALYSDLYNNNIDIDRWAASDGVFKYIFNEGVEECYNLNNDPSESNPISPLPPRCLALRNNRPPLSDFDGDGFDDRDDDFPRDGSEWIDTDEDGIGNNADLDDDNDGVPDVDDAFPRNPNESSDADGDGTGDNADTDDDNDGFSDEDEIIAGSDPLDAASIPSDLDGDFISDANDSDLDGDGTGNAWDVFPTDNTEWADTDGDGIGDNADNDIDNDGRANGVDPFPYNADFDRMYIANRHSAWQINDTGETSQIVDQGVEVNVQSVDDTATDSFGNSGVQVMSNGIPNYRFLVTEEFLQFLNTANPLGRSNGQAVWRNNAGMRESTAAPGDVVEFGEDINYNSRLDTAAQPGCSASEGYGYWPPGPGCPDSVDVAAGIDNTKDGIFPAAPVDDENACFAGAGNIGYLIDGSAIYGYTDALSYVVATNSFAPNVNGGDDIWHSNAPFWEFYDVDACAGHAAARARDYHHHGWSQCIGTLSGDTGAAHSPIIGYMADGYAIHGPWHAEGVLARSAWVARDYDQIWDPANGEFGCDGSGERNCTIDDPYDPLNSGITDRTGTGPSMTDNVNSISSNIFIATTGAFLEDFYLDPVLAANGQSATPGRHLDENNGHAHGSYGYHYHMTITDADNALGYDFAFPYSAGPQFKGRAATVDGVTDQCPVGF